MKSSIYSIVILFSILIIIPLSVFKALLWLRKKSITDLRKYLLTNMTSYLTHYLISHDLLNTTSPSIDNYTTSNIQRMDSHINTNDIIATIDSHLNNNCNNNINIKVGTILIASNTLPCTSQFYHSIILIIEEYHHECCNDIDKMKGIILNSYTCTNHHTDIIIKHNNNNNNNNNNIINNNNNNNNTKKIIDDDGECDLYDVYDNSDGDSLHNMYTNDLLSTCTIRTYNQTKVDVNEEHVHIIMTDNETNINRHNSRHNNDDCNDINDIYDKKAMNNVSTYMTKTQAMFGGPDNKHELTMIHDYCLCSEYSDSITVYNHQHQNHHSNHQNYHSNHQNHHSNHQNHHSNHKNHHHHVDYQYQRNSIIINSSNHHNQSSDSDNSTSSSQLYIVSHQYIHDTLTSIQNYQYYHKNNNNDTHSHHYYNATHNSIKHNSLQHDHHHEHTQESFKIFRGYCTWQRSTLQDEINNGLWHMLHSDKVSRVNEVGSFLADFYNTKSKNKNNSRSCDDEMKDQTWQRLYDMVKEKL